MGGNNSRSYAQPVTQKVDGQSPIYRGTGITQLLSRPQPNVNTLKDAYLISSKRFANKNVQGRILRNQQGEATIKYTTYSELMDQAAQIGSYIVRGEKFAVNPGEQMRFVGVFAKNMPEWAAVDIGCALYRLTTIPLYDTLGDESISYVLNHTKFTTCFVSNVGLKALTKTKDLANLKTLINFEPVTKDMLDFFSAKGIQVHYIYDVIQEQRKKPLIDYNLPEFTVKANDCFTFSYTSGTTGPPKGAMLSHGNFVSFLAAVDDHPDIGLTENDIAISYLPLPHILERQYSSALYYHGSTIVYYSGDVQKLKDDLAIVKPTIFLSVPRLFSRFYDVIREKFNSVTGYQKILLDHALNAKLQNAKTNGSWTHSIYDPILFAKTKEALGGRVRLMLSGSAPLLSDVQQFLKVVMCCPLLEGYGQTESTGAATIQAALDPFTRHVGGPTANCEMKLVDIPEMKYLSTDFDQQGRSAPRGQIWMRGPLVFLGYYHDEEKTKEAITPDGWLKTGDVGLLTPGTNALKIIDRKKNIFKLQQGQYVAAEKVEAVLMKCPILAEVFLHGESTESFVIAVVTVHKNKLIELAKSLNIQGEFSQLCTRKEIRTQIVSILNDLGKSAGLQGFEQVKNIHIEQAGFLARGILTNTMKLQRHEAKILYVKEVKTMYEEGMLPIRKK